jgi:hypothetical protein
MKANRVGQFPGCSCLFLLAPWFLVGCSRAPSVDILGSFFPGWLVCLVSAIVLTALTHLVLSRLRVKLSFPALVYPSLAALYTLALWLIFFH